MEKWWQLNKILWKQYLVRHRIWIVLLLIVGIFVMIFGGQKEAEDNSGVKVGIVAEDEDGRDLLFKLREEEGIFRFRSFEDKEEMLRQVESGALECGLVLPEGFYKNIIKGKTMRQIPLYYAPSSSAHKIAYEVVFSYLFEKLSDQILIDYIDYSEENGIFSEEEKDKQAVRLLEQKEQYSKNGSTFSFIYERIGEEGKEEISALNTIRGCIAVLIFMMSLLGLAGCCEMSEMLKGLSRSNRMKIKEYSLHISVLSSVLLGGILIFLSGTGEGIWKELSGLVFFFIVLEIYIRVLNLILKRAEAVYSLIPVLVLGSLLFCPVFIQISSYLPAATCIEKLFPVYYYLYLF